MPVVSKTLTWRRRNRGTKQHSNGRKESPRGESEASESGGVGRNRRVGGVRTMDMATREHRPGDETRGVDEACQKVRADTCNLPGLRRGGTSPPS